MSGFVLWVYEHPLAFVALALLHLLVRFLHARACQ